MLLRWALALAVVGLSAVLLGCETETEYERHLRESCRWDPDIKLRGCDEHEFGECIDRCEFCLGGLQTPFEGRDDECAQLKCGAYCAKRSGEACAATYRRLCEGGVEVLGGGCAVDCSGAARPGLAPGALGVALGGALLGGRGAAGARAAQAAALAAAAAAAALLLHGCDDACPPATPSLPEWSVDLQRLDRAAGCQDEWDWMWGNPCAFGVPVLLAKRGVEPGADEEFIRGRVKNERHSCLERAPAGYCHRWTALREGCEAEGLAVCACLRPGNGSGYCEAWQCVAKRAGQRRCREACCGGGCTPCVECGSHGSSRFVMSPARYDGLFAAEGAALAASAGRAEALAHLRRSYWESFDFGGECIAPRRVMAPAEVPCSAWREVATGLSRCSCQQASPGLDHCRAWSCEEGRAGMFSVLFAKDMAYGGLVEAEPRRYECLESARLASGAARCVRWRGEGRGQGRVQTVQCKATCSAAACDTWACNEYELPRIREEGWGGWRARLLRACAHLCWMWLPLLVVARGRAKGGCNALGLSPCGLLLACFLIWAPAFLRWVGSEGRWRAPGRPFLGLLLMLGPTWTLAAVVWACGTERMERWSPLLLVLPPMVLAALTWTNGAVAAGGLVGLLLLLLATAASCRRICRCCCMVRDRP